MTKWCVKDHVSKMVCDKAVCERWSVTVCERWCVAKWCERWCVKDGVGEGLGIKAIFLYGTSGTTLVLIAHIEIVLLITEYIWVCSFQIFSLSIQS